MPDVFMAKLTVDQGRVGLELLNPETREYEAIPIDSQIFWKVAHWLKAVSEKAEREKYWEREIG
jgi:hypothetical protein